MRFARRWTSPVFLGTLAMLGQEPRYMSSDEYRKYMHGRIPIERRSSTNTTCACSDHREPNMP